MSTNPNNCATCDHTARNDDDSGHCYMFRDAPTSVCMQHTGRDAFTRDVFATMYARKSVAADVTCLSCGSRSATAETIPCGH